MMRKIYIYKRLLLLYINPCNIEVYNEAMYIGNKLVGFQIYIYIYVYKIDNLY